MGLDITTLLEIRTWRAFDVDDEGRVLAGFDETGSVQLVELAGPDARPVPLTALPGACRGRYLPGERAVVVEHDDGGNERGQLSLLSLDGHRDGQRAPVDLDGLAPLVRDSRYVHKLLDVLPGRVVYATNRRNEIDFDVVIRNVATGVEEVVYDGGGMAMSGTASSDARWVLITLAGAAPMSDRLVLVDTMPETAGGHFRELTDDRPSRHEGARWIGGRHAFSVASDDETDLTGIVRFDLASDSWQPLVSPTGHDLACWPSPNGRLLLIESNDDGVSRLALHDAGSGERLREGDLPADGVVTFPQPEPGWSPDSRLVAISFTAPGAPGPGYGRQPPTPRAAPAPPVPRNTGSAVGGISSSATIEESGLNASKYVPGGVWNLSSSISLPSGSIDRSGIGSPSSTPRIVRSSSAVDTLPLKNALSLADRSACSVTRPERTSVRMSPAESGTPQRSASARSASPTRVVRSSIASGALVCADRAAASEVRNINTESPARMRSPCSSTRSSTGMPLTNVPLELPRSRSENALSVGFRVSAAWRRLMKGSPVNTMSPDSRPTTVSSR